MDGSAVGVDVELSARLSDQLRLLALGAVGAGPGLVEGLTTLVSTLTSTVSGYAGLRLSIVQSGHPVHLSVLSSSEGVTSLRLPLRAVSSTFEDGGSLVVWSTVPGSLVDLAADLDYVFRRAANSAAQHPSSVVELDVDLPMPDVESGFAGLDELATIHRAAGLLIERGHDPDTVHDLLRSRAAGDGMSTHAWADRALRLR